MPLPRGWLQKGQNLGSKGPKQVSKQPQRETGSVGVRNSLIHYHSTGETKILVDRGRKATRNSLSDKVIKSFPAHPLSLAVSNKLRQAPCVSNKLRQAPCVPITHPGSKV